MINKIIEFCANNKFVVLLVIGMGVTFITGVVQLLRFLSAGLHRAET